MTSTTPPPAASTLAARRSRGRVTTVYLLTCAVIGVAGGILLIPANWVSTVMFATVPFANAALGGLWILPAVVALRLLQRPGAGLLVGLISGLVIVPFSGYGFTSVLTNLFWAFFPEVVFLVVGYRFWTLAQHYAGAVLVGVAYPLFAWASFDLGSFPIGLQIAFVALNIASGVAATAIGLGIAAGLRKAGVARAAARRPRPRVDAAPDDAAAV
ncbi:hypothetical protein GCM10027515_20100 [Schumannella luteola]|uniref:Energy-coupling factor transport system substrate-specific component n=1 Tax=Schumannella luteola TaxID=472059 RepID=A0A852YFY0_9MICO|nr:energy-coupling factor transport system substrate-specific component [Schumannella luteola]TPX04053.1 hypothetical protein FJ656_13720 [Schumannella luteola]